MIQSSLQPSRRRKCRICKSLFKPRSMEHVACGPGCAAQVIELKRLKEAAKREKVERKDLADRKLAMKSRSQWLAEAQAAFNQFIRLRDEKLTCISCGRFHTGAYDAGHYRSVGAMPALRFHEDNVHKQCVPCNQFKSGNVIEYRIRLVARIGIDRVEFLERDHPPAKYTIDDAKYIKSFYKARVKALKEKE